MRNIRKQLYLISNLSQSVLQYRLQTSQNLVEQLKDVKKKVRQMINNSVEEEGIAELLVNRENFQIRNKLLNKLNQKEVQKQLQIWVNIHISCVEKRTCEIFNEQMWQFGLSSVFKNPKTPSNAAEGVVSIIQHVLKHLECSTLLPSGKQNRNRYMLNHKVTISDHKNAGHINNFQSLSEKIVLIARTQNEPIKRITCLHFYNDKKIQQNIRQTVIQKSCESSQNSKRCSSNSTVDTSRRVSLYEYYDDELDITVLSGEDFAEQNGEQIILDVKGQESEDEFQLLVEETPNEDDLFFKQNHGLFKQLSEMQNYYL